MNHRRPTLEKGGRLHFSDCLPPEKIDSQAILIKSVVSWAPFIGAARILSNPVQPSPGAATRPLPLSFHPYL